MNGLLSNLLRGGRLRAAVALFSLTALLVATTTGCSVSGSCTVSGGSGTATSGSCTIRVSTNATGVTAMDFANAPSSGYSVIVNVPASNFTYDANSTTQTTLTATTDTGYTSSVVVDMQQVASTTAPVADGYAVYAFAAPNTASLQNWVQSVSQHTNQTVTVSSDTLAGFQDLGAAGNYTFYVSISSTQTGTVSVGSTTYRSTGSNAGPGGQPRPNEN